MVVATKMGVISIRNGGTYMVINGDVCVETVVKYEQEGIHRYIVSIKTRCQEMYAEK
jgi:hypothetical protein